MTENLWIKAGPPYTDSTGGLVSFETPHGTAAIQLDEANVRILPQA
jgi:hypothetical protein